MKPSHIAGVTTPAPADPVPRPIPVKLLTSKQASDALWFYNSMTAEPPLSLLLSMLLPACSFEELADYSTREALFRPLHAFFSQVRVHRIMQAVAEGLVDERVIGRLQTELKKTNEGRMHSLWCFYSGWLKIRILICYEPTSLPQDVEVLVREREVDLKELIKLPLRDPCQLR